jgi:hypothetical protein
VIRLVGRGGATHRHRFGGEDIKRSRGDGVIGGLSVIRGSPHCLSRFQSVDSERLHSQVTSVLWLWDPWRSGDRPAPVARFPNGGCNGG